MGWRTRSFKCGMPETQLVQPVSIVTPAHRAEGTIVRAARSVLAQTHRAWEWLVVADDAADYEAVLARAGISDARFRFLSTGGTGAGSPLARNIGLDAARYRYAAILDADDLMAPEKLERAVAALATHGMVSSALQVVSADLRALRQVAAGADRVLDPGRYKFVNISMDSMLVHDRRAADPRFDTTLPCLTDIDFVLKLFAHNASCFHLGTPLHTYVKEPQSASNKPGASARIVGTKERILAQLRSGGYPLADAAGLAGMIRFYEISLEAEKAYGPLLETRPTLLFEDHLEGFIAAASTSAT